MAGTFPQERLSAGHLIGGTKLRRARWEGQLLPVNSMNLFQFNPLSCLCCSVVILLIHFPSEQSVYVRGYCLFICPVCAFLSLNQIRVEAWSECTTVFFILVLCNIIFPLYFLYSSNFLLFISHVNTYFADTVTSRLEGRSPGLCCKYLLNHAGEFESRQ